MANGCGNGVYFNITLRSDSDWYMWVCTWVCERNTQAIVGAMSSAWQCLDDDVYERECTLFRGGGYTLLLSNFVSDITFEQVH